MKVCLTISNKLTAFKIGVDYSSFPMLESDLGSHTPLCSDVAHFFFKKVSDFCYLIGKYVSIKVSFNQWSKKEKHWWWLRVGLCLWQTTYFKPDAWRRAELHQYQKSSTAANWEWINFLAVLSWEREFVSHLLSYLGVRSLPKLAVWVPSTLKGNLSMSAT